jgi:hypothetical protein
MRHIWVQFLINQKSKKMKKYFLAAVLIMAFGGLAGAQTTTTAKTKTGIAKTSTKRPVSNPGIKTAGMQTGDNKTSAVATKQKTQPSKTKVKSRNGTTGKAAAIKHHKAKKKPKKKKS